MFSPKERRTNAGDIMSRCIILSVGLSCFVRLDRFDCSELCAKLSAAWQTILITTGQTETERDTDRDRERDRQR
jgi:hypothetical protein